MTIKIITGALPGYHFLEEDGELLFRQRQYTAEQIDEFRFSEAFICAESAACENNDSQGL